MSYFDGNSYQNWEINPPTFYEFNDYHIGHDYISQNFYSENCSYHDHNQGWHDYSDFSLNQHTELSSDEKLDVIIEMLQNSSEIVQNQSEKLDQMISEFTEKNLQAFDSDSFCNQIESETKKNDKLKYDDLSTFNNFLYDETENSYLNVESYGQNFEFTSNDSPITQFFPVSDYEASIREIEQLLYPETQREGEIENSIEEANEIKEMICKETEHDEYIDPFLLESINFSQLASPCFDPPCDGPKITETVKILIEGPCKTEFILRDISLFFEPTIHSLPNHVIKIGLTDQSLGSQIISQEKKLLTWDYQRDSRWKISMFDPNFELFLHVCTDPSLQDFRLRLFVPKDFKSVLL